MKLSKVYKYMLGALAVVLFTSGCCPKPEIRYVDRVSIVEVPVKTNIEKPTKPVKGVNLSDTLLNIKEYMLKYDAKVDLANGNQVK